MAQRAATAADVVAFAPELVDVAPSTVFADAIAAWLPFALASVDLVAWGENASLAHALLTAHYVVTAPSGGGYVGAIVSESDGPSSRSFERAAVTDGELATTRYGVAFLRLRRIAAVARGVTAAMGGSCGCGSEDW